MQCKGHFLSWVWNTILFLLLLDYPSNSTWHKLIPKCASGRADSRVHSVTLCWSRTRNTLRRRIPDRGLEFEGIGTLQTLWLTAVLKPGETKPLLLGLQPWIISIVILSTKAIRVPYVSRNCLPKVQSQLYVIAIYQKMDTPPSCCPPPGAKSSLAVSRPEGALAVISWNSFILQREKVRLSKHVTQPRLRTWAQCWVHSSLPAFAHWLWVSLEEMWDSQRAATFLKVVIILLA